MGPGVLFVTDNTATWNVTQGQYSNISPKSFLVLLAHVLSSYYSLLEGLLAASTSEFYQLARPSSSVHEAHFSVYRDPSGL